MKATRTTTLILACLASHAAYGNGPRLGGNDASLGATGGDSLTTSRLNGEVLFAGRELFGQNNVGEDAIFGRSDNLRLGFGGFNGDGQTDGVRARISAAIGYNDNVAETLGNTGNSAFYYIGGDMGASVSNGPLDVIVGAGAGATYYDEDLDYRDEDENWVADLNASIAARYQFSDSFRARLYARGYYGGNASVSREFLKGGVSSNNYFFWDLETGVDGRFDGQTLGNKGVEWSADFSWGGMNEDGSSGGAVDNYDINFRGEGRYNINQDTTAYVAANYGHREFDNLRPFGMSQYNVNSHNYSVGGGARAAWGSDFTWAAEAGVEQRKYDDTPASGQDEQTEFYANGSINWKPTDSLSVAIVADYGIQNFNINEGPVDAFVDTVGLRSGLNAIYQWNETTSVRTDWTLTRGDGSDVISNTYGDCDFMRWACGLQVDHRLNDRVDLFLRGDAIQLDNGMDDDTHFNVLTGGRVGF